MIGGMEEWRNGKEKTQAAATPPRGKCCSFLDRIYMIVHDTSL